MYYLKLKALKLHGEIAEIECHPHFPLIVNGRTCGRGYTADFLVTYPDGRQTVIEVKGREHRDWPLRRDLFRALYPNLELVIIRA